mgnify:CR=1 FL=1
MLHCSGRNDFLEKLPDIVRAVACSANDVVCFVKNCFSVTLSLDGNVTLGSANDGLPGDAGTLELAGRKGLRARGGHGHGGHL